MGGTCDSVGVGGCWLGGCYGPFTKLFGNGAINLLQARVVLPNGTLITCSESQHPDVFWTLRGGGGANIAVVTQCTARTHPAPNHMITSGFSGKAKDLNGFRALMDFVLRENAKVMSWSSAPGVQDCGGEGPSFNANAFGRVPHTKYNYRQSSSYGAYIFNGVTILSSVLYRVWR